MRNRQKNRHMEKRELEHQHFIAFRGKVHNFPEGEIWHEDSPDFLVHASSGVLGVEHCCVYKPSASRIPEHAIAGWQDDVTRWAQEHAELRGIPPLEVVMFYTNSLIPRSKRLDLARAIANTVCERAPQEFGRVNLEYEDLPDLRDYVESIWMIRYEHLYRHYWSNPRAQYVLQHVQTLLQGEINKKAKRYRSYLKHCHECWLLMVSDGTQPGQSIRPDKASLDHVYRSPFARTYFFDIALGQLHPLKTTLP